MEKRTRELVDRLQYIDGILAGRNSANHRLLATKLEEFLEVRDALDPRESEKQLLQLMDLFNYLEQKLDRELTPMDKVRIVRHPHRICLKDILENVYDNYTEVGGQDEHSIDPSMLIARAYFTRLVGHKVINQSVMVIGQEKGHGEEFRNGGSVKPWGNAKALHYMKVAETENIPIHSFIFTPGSYPVEDYPGAAQQIARNLYEMSTLRVPVVAVFSEGGSGGAEAIGLADRRLMLSHGYYSVISPEGAAAIEGGLKGGKVTPELIAKCARLLKMSAYDNLNFGYVDRIIPEPPLGARPHHYEFFKLLRQEILRATNEVVTSVKGMKLYRAFTLRHARAENGSKRLSDLFVRWSLSSGAADRMIWKRYRKFRMLSRDAFVDRKSTMSRIVAGFQDAAWSTHSFLRYEFVGKHRKRIGRMVEDIGAEAKAVACTVRSPVRRVFGLKKRKERELTPEQKKLLTELSCPEDGPCVIRDVWSYISPRSLEDRTMTCPNSATHGCHDLWTPDLFAGYAGVCPNCGHHFRMEYQWYLYNVFGYADAFEFNEGLESSNPLRYENFGLKLDQAKSKTGLKCSCITFETDLDGIKAVVATLVAPFRGGSVGAAEGEKFIRAAERARKKHYPFVTYVHGTAGIRIQEGVNGVIQMPRCTMAVRRYIEAGGLYLVIYDTNSYAGPVASFLGCSPYQFAVRSSRIGFAGPGVIAETTGEDVAPDYHSAFQALSRGHIQGIWDRREIRKNLRQALLTVGGRNLYYR